MEELEEEVLVLGEEGGGLMGEVVVAAVLDVGDLEGVVIGVDVVSVVIFISVFVVVAVAVAVAVDLVSCGPCWLGEDIGLCWMSFVLEVVLEVVVVVLVVVGNFESPSDDDGFELFVSWALFT